VLDAQKGIQNLPECTVKGSFVLLVGSLGPGSIKKGLREQEIV